jgi:hypothetical protein
MTVEYARFTSNRRTSFDRNPALGLPRNANTQGNGHGAGTCH